jgi:hypothetical protein
MVPVSLPFLPANSLVPNLHEGLAVDLGGLLKFVHRVALERKPAEQGVHVYAKAPNPYSQMT